MFYFSQRFILLISIGHIDAAYYSPPPPSPHTLEARLSMRKRKRASCKKLVLYLQIDKKILVFISILEFLIHMNFSCSIQYLLPKNVYHPVYFSWCSSKIHPYFVPLRLHLLFTPIDSPRLCISRFCLLFSNKSLSQPFSCLPSPFFCFFPQSFILL